MVQVISNGAPFVCLSSHYHGCHQALFMPGQTECPLGSAGITETLHWYCWFYLTPHHCCSPVVYIFHFPHSFPQSKILIVAAPRRKFIHFAGGSYSSTLEHDLTRKHPLWCKIIEFGIMLSHPSAFWEIGHVSLSCISIVIVACFLCFLSLFF